MSNIINYLSKYLPIIEKYYHLALDYINRLDQRGITIIIIVTVVLILILALRLFGLGAVIGLLLLLALAYVLYINNFLGIYRQHTNEENQHLKLIEEEEQKN